MWVCGGVGWACWEVVMQVGYVCGWQYILSTLVGTIEWCILHHI